MTKLNEKIRRAYGPDSCEQCGNQDTLYLEKNFGWLCEDCRVVDNEEEKDVN